MTGSLVNKSSCMDFGTSKYKCDVMVREKQIQPYLHCADCRYVMSQSHEVMSSEYSFFHSNTAQIRDDVCIYYTGFRFLYLLNDAFFELLIFVTLIFLLACAAAADMVPCSETDIVCVKRKLSSMWHIVQHSTMVEHS